MEQNSRLRAIFQRMKGLLTRRNLLGTLLLMGLLAVSMGGFAGPGFLSVVPPLVAVLMALWLREVYISLLLAVLSGAWILALEQKGLPAGLLSGWISVLDRYVLGALNDRDHLSVLVFSMLIGGMVALLSRNGGMQGVVVFLSKYANNTRSGQLVTWFLGIVIFFDDYANTLLVGHTMRPVTDRLRISRAKLAYLVDATAAPVASVAFIWTWLGAEFGDIKVGLSSIGELDLAPYQVFMASIPYSFYSWLTLAMMFILIWRRRDFGPMLAAERAARGGLDSTRVGSATGGDAEAWKANEGANEFDMKPGINARAWMALIPVATVIFGVLAGLVATGWDETVWNNPALSLGVRCSTIIGQADSFKALLYGSFAGCTVALFLTLGTRTLPLQESVESVVLGFKTMLPASLILVLAWALAMLTEEMHTANYISERLVALQWSPMFLPTLAFVAGAMVAFATGTSWGTMAILYPLLLPAGWAMLRAQGWGVEESLPIFYQLVSSILAGSVLGDHCSPISDTTIMSSLSSSCDHLAHVKTQMPYALIVGVGSGVWGWLPAAAGWSLWLVYPICLGALWFLVGYWGRDTEI
ncbi:MAG: Na+/H+ antiporter NhaC family protein [Bacteroidota bacterium]